MKNNFVDFEIPDDMVDSKLALAHLMSEASSYTTSRCITFTGQHPVLRVTIESDIEIDSELKDALKDAFETTIQLIKVRNIKDS